MEPDDAGTPKQRYRKPWWVKSVVFSVIATTVLGIVLSVTGYPTEEWPFVAGIMGIVLFMTTLAVSIVLLVTAKLLASYRRSVYEVSGLDIEVEDAKIAAHVGVVLMIKAVISLLYAGLVWGVAWIVTLAVLGGFGLPTFAPGIHVVAVALAIAGGSGLSTLVGLSFVGYFLLGRMAQGTQAAPWVVRLVWTVVRVSQRGAQAGSLDGSPLRVRAG